MTVDALAVAGASPDADALAEDMLRLGDGLVAAGAIDQRTLERARRVAADSGNRLDRVITQLGMISERSLAEALARLIGAPLVEPADYPAAPLFSDRLKPKFLRKAGVLPIAADDDAVVVATTDPLERFNSAAIALALGRPVRLAVAVPIEFDAAFERLYAAPEDAVGVAAAVEDAPGGASEDDAERLKDLASEAPVIRLVNQLIARAVETRASDVHIEPFEDRLRVRYRYDGVLHEADSPPARLQAAIVSRIKIMARLDIAERRLPQDGRIRLSVRGSDVDFRVSTVPSLYGESVVLRVLDRTAVHLDYAKLGLPDDIIRGMQGALDLPNGLVLVTGPTGSGKTTTLYTGLLRLNAIARNIITVEDPIEYQLGGINQIQVKPQIGLDFANLLRSILRQDPDVIMIGEIRDYETAEIAVQAALTGHLVLSTLHTNSAAATVTRLRDMGVEDYLIAATLKGVLAQRLVRRLCPHCKAADPMSPLLAERFGLRRLAADTAELTVYRAVGCAECRDTGYRGRRAIAELLVPSPEIDRLVFARADHAAIEESAVAHGMRPIFEAGLLAVIEGDTTVEEVVRCIRGEASNGLQASDQRGFTLIELLVVIAILGLAMLLFVGYQPPWRRGAGLNGAAAEIAEGLRRARSEAILQNRPVRFGIDVASHKYEVGAGPLRVLPPELTITLLTVAGEKQSAHTADIRLNPDGTSSGGRISLREGARAVAVGIDWLTGRVSVADVR